MNISEVNIDHVAVRKGIPIDMLRLDKVHPVVSGNKFFKLSRYLDEAKVSAHRTILTFGGAYSNHLAATAYACNELRLKSIGIVRGERGEVNSETIADCRRMGMEIHFMDRGKYRRIAEHPPYPEMVSTYGPCTIIPMGGFGEKGARGASDILDFIPPGYYTHICVAAGTATTLAGLMLKERHELLVAFPVLKGLEDLYQRLQALGAGDTSRLTIMPGYHFGGFGKRNPELISFMNSFFAEYEIPLDFVYTGKMMFGLLRLIEHDFFPPGSEILAIHTGGLQGNRSLPENALCY